MRKYKDLTGQRFGRLVVEKLYSHDKRCKWLCRCDCGNEHVVDGGNLISGNVSSCGCLRRESMLKHSFKKTHGCTDTRLFGIWGSMRRRCRDCKSKDYKNYGARGITVCDDWLDFVNFKLWSENNGYSDNLSIDRIDVNGNYCPENCRWVDAKTQCNNRRSNHILEYDGDRHTVSEWSDITGIPPKTIIYRVNAGWNIKDVLTTKVSYNNRLAKHI